MVGKVEGAGVGVDEVVDEVWLVLDEDVEEEVVEVVGATALAEENAGPIVKSSALFWQHCPVFDSPQQKGVVDELQGSTSGYCSIKWFFVLAFSYSRSLRKTTYVIYRNSGK